MKFAKKSLGQNFLIDKNIIKKIVSLVKVKNNNIVEIGPGKGALTTELLKRQPKSLHLIEKDKVFVKELNIKYSQNNLVKIHNADILKFDLEKIVKKNTNIFGNLPYNISSQILTKIIKFKKWPPDFENVVFMFQKELGERILGKFSTSEYGRLSILTNYRMKYLEKFLISSNCFFPKPKVTSMVIHFQPKKENSYKINKIENLEKITNIFFNNKRKIIKKNLEKILNRSKIAQLSNLNKSLRPSNLKPDIYYKITQLFESE